jgi:monovalent cation:H+ antiporter-2, CPA2 family
MATLPVAHRCPWRGAYHAGVDVTAPPIFELGVVLLLAAAAGFIARRLRLPAVVGYLAVGLAISPFTPGYVADRAQLQLLADVGVVLLLFEVGIEVDLARLRREHGGLLWAAPAQALITTIIATAAGMWAGLPPFGAGLVGLGIALSSSVVIVNITRSRRRTTTRETEETLLGWSVLQDVTGVVVAILLLATSRVERPIGVALGGLALYAVLAIATAVLLPRILRGLRAEHDLFLIVSVASGLAIAGIGSIVAELPLALAAFVAGLAITEGPDAAEARRRLLPFRDLLAVLFFVAIGTLIDPTALGRGLGWVAFVVGLIVVAKVATAYVLARAARLRANPLQLAVGLGQVGEFSFVLASVGLASGVVPAELYAAVLTSVAITIVASTVLVRVVGKGDPAPA